MPIAMTFAAINRKPDCKPIMTDPETKKAHSDSRAVVFLMGATACGKTELAARMCDAMGDDMCDAIGEPILKHRRAELISVDAAQVYRGMDIGTAKPAREFLRNYPHHLIDIRDPHESYDAAQFCADARAAIADIHARGNLPILVGGTMFYFAALEAGLSELPSADAAVRRELNAEIARRGLAAMHDELRDIDAKLAARILPSDAQRIQRALEIYRLGGRSPSAVMADSARAPLALPIIKLALFLPDRATLHRRIDARFGKMLDDGLVDEVKTLLAKHDGENLPAFRIVGYRQVIDYLRGELTQTEMRERAIAATRQLAKRQLTWLRRRRNVVWIGADSNAACQARDYLAIKLAADGRLK